MLNKIYQWYHSRCTLHCKRSKTNNSINIYYAKIWIIYIISNRNNESKSRFKCVSWLIIFGHNYFKWKRGNPLIFKLSTWNHFTLSCLNNGLCKIKYWFFKLINKIELYILCGDKLENSIDCKNIYRFPSVIWYEKIKLWLWYYRWAQ